MAEQAQTQPAPAAVKPAETAIVESSKKGISLKNIIGKFAPEGIDPATFYELISTQIMGVDARGNKRPIEDMLFYLNVAKKLGLDPSLKQIYPVYRWDSKLGKEKMIIQTGIDGFRLVAQRSNQYGGQDDATFKVEEVYNPVTGESAKQLIATVTVYKVVGNTRMPVTASARWNEYAQKGKNAKGQEYYMGLWSSMPYNQLGKCAEALALRKGFPQDLSGLYIPEELDKERGDIKVLDLPTPKSVVDKQAAKAEAKVEVTVDNKPAEATQPAPKAEELKTGEAKKTVLENFKGNEQQ